MNIFGKEPAVVLAASSEVVKAVIPTLIIFGIIHWTGEQVAQVMLTVGVVIAFVNTWLTRAQTTPESTLNKLIKEAVKSSADTTVGEVKAAVAAKES